MELTDGTLLGGRVAYRQPREGYRTGIEPVLMAACVPARPGTRVLEGGTGSGAALLCLLARVPGVFGLAVERDPALAAVAQANLAANGMAAEGHAPGGQIRAGDVLCMDLGGGFEHAMANPPWHDPRAPASPDRMRDAAKRGEPDLLGQWAGALARAVRPGGSLTWVLPAGAIPEALAAMSAAGCGSHVILPLWPRAGQEARLAVLRGVREGRGACRMLPGLVLHDGPGFSADARAILWDGAGLTMG